MKFFKVRTVLTVLLKLYVEKSFNSASQFLISVALGLKPGQLHCLQGRYSALAVSCCKRDQNLAHGLLVTVTMLGIHAL